MSSEVVVDVEGLSKCYPVYSRPHHRLLQMLRRGKKQFYQEFWALRDVSFSIRAGETVGIIGRNGSGKSTLLQLIAGTLRETGGVVKTKGRIAALLELGSGFNPELTGRENVTLYASLFGFTAEEIVARMSSIEQFAEIGLYFGQPLKTYSSGMAIRLAFAVIAHIDADILIIDEALAVGDTIFIQKCMRFIREFQAKGTLLFVSHDLSSVLSLCDRAIWLDKGSLVHLGPAKEVTQAYLRHTLELQYRGKAKLSSGPITADSEF